MALKSIPSRVEGIDCIEIMVVNDGSTDRTVDVARSLGVHHIVDLDYHQGLARAFEAGLRSAGRLGADFVVNLDADNQYCAEDIPILLSPLMQGTADMVVGERPIQAIEHFGATKRLLQNLGSYVVRSLSGTDVKDTQSGFRAYNRKAVTRLRIFDSYTYTHESLLAAHDLGLRVAGVPIRVNPGVLRHSRLMKSTVHYVTRTALTIFRYYAVYNPYRLFLGLAFFTGLVALALVGRFLWNYFLETGRALIQSLVIAGMLAGFATMSLCLAVLGDLIRLNRKLLQGILEEMAHEGSEKSTGSGGSDCRGDKECR